MKTTDKIINARLGANIRRIRELKGLKQDDMADRLGILQNTYSKIELGQTKLTVERLDQIAKVFELDLVEIIKFDESMVFNNHNQAGGKAANVLVDNASEQLVETLKAQVEHLQEEINFLRDLVGRKNR